MPNGQTTLTGGTGVAEELGAENREISIAEFFEKNKQMLGFDSPARGLVTAVKEAVDNSLDATEEAGILPSISVEITEEGDYYQLAVEDNGPGITEDQIPKVFGKLLYGSRFHAREMSRGQQGIGISAAVMYAQLTSGKPATVISRPKGSETAHYYRLTIDTDTNKPNIREKSTTEWDSDHGTRIELEMEANMRARQQLHDYIEYTAVVNPHAEVTFDEPSLDEPKQFERVTDELPAETEEILPHPHGVEHGSLKKLLAATDSYSLSGFLQQEFTRVGQKTAENVLDEFKDRTFGRGAAWLTPPVEDSSSTPDPEESDGDSTTRVDAAALKQRVVESVRNKASDETDDFAERVTETVVEADEVARHEVTAIVSEAAEDVEDGFATRFGSTVRENAADAVWSALTDQRERTLHQRINEATSTRKSEDAVAAIAERLASNVADETGDEDRLTHTDLRGLVDRAADLTEDIDGETFGETARENITDEIWSHFETVPEDAPPVREVHDDRDKESALLDAMRATSIMAPPTDCLSPIEADNLEAGMQKVYDADFYAASTRDADVHGGDPFIAEAGIAYGGDITAEGDADLMRFANRVPLVYQRGACAITDVLKDIRWNSYNVSVKGGGLPTEPMVLVVHVASTNVPFTSESKDAVANVPEIEDEIELAVREAARELKSYLKKQRSLEKRREKKNVIGDILPEMAEKVGSVTGNGTPPYSEARARIMNDVLIERSTGENSDAVTIEVTNHHNDTEATPTVVETVDHLDSEPTIVTDTDQVTVEEADDSWQIKWTPTVSPGGASILEYVAPADRLDGLNIDGIEDEKVTVIDDAHAV